MRKKGVKVVTGPGVLSSRGIMFWTFILTLLVIVGLLPNQASAAQAAQEIVSYEENDAGLTYSGSWDRPWDDRASGSYYQRSGTKDSKMSFSFYGTGIKWYAPLNTNNGIAEVRIDGKVEIAALDLYSSQYAGQMLVYAKNHLDEGNHTFEIVVTGNKNASSSGAYVLIDYLRVINSNDSDPPASPEAPALHPTDSSVALIWKANMDPDLEGYNLYRSTSPLTGFQKINSWVHTAGNSFNDSGLVNGSTYYYRITAIDNKGNESNPSDAVSALPALYAGTHEESAGIVYTGTWENYNNSNNSGSNAKRSRTAGDTIDLYFYGTSVQWTG
ncbi:MAG TPA: fibronectin type III domain-containing protein, partial [Desulfitobacteriaceae bacterium]|nr:fibronectin type III domain-containing protein [Desulfitobacteriaceae bacterium]